MTKYTTTSVKSSGLCLAFLLSIFTIPTFADNQTLGDDPQCDNTTLYTTNGSVTLNANWSATEYPCRSGEYLRASDASWQQCPADSFCNGNGTYTYTDGVDGCLTACPNNYPNSAAGANSQSWCYTNSTTSCATRNPYLGEHGIPTYANVTADCRIYDPTDEWDNDNDCKLNSISDCSITSVQCDAGYTSTGSFGPLYGYIGDAALQKAIRNKSFDAIGSHGDQTGLNSGDWEATYNDGTKIKGTSSCNTDGAVVEVMHKYGKDFVENRISYDDYVSYLRDAGATNSQIDYLNNLFSQLLSGELSLNKLSESVYSEFFVAPSNANYTASATGNYCWCKMTGYTLSGAQSETTVSNSRWVFREFDEDENCAQRCAHQCAKDMGWTNMFDQFWRQALFGSLASYPTCEPNTINLDWNLNNGSVHGQSQCTYNGGITLPTAPTRSGYTFGGWRVGAAAAQCVLSQHYTNESVTYDAQHVKWEPIAQNGYTMANEWTGATSGLEAGEWSVTFTEGTIKGRALCSSTNGTYATTGTPNETGGGEYCWCAGTDFGNSCHVASPSWVSINNGFVVHYVSSDDCASFCVYDCARYVEGVSGFRQAIFGVTQ